jgi:hypothetical protein
MAKATLPKMPKKSIIPRKFRIGQWVLTKSGLRGQVIGSALYGINRVTLKPLPGAHVEYRIKVPGRARTMYRVESDLRKG